MNPISSILVIVDPTAQVHPAVTKGAQLAMRLGARLDLYICDTKAARESRLTASRRDRRVPPHPKQLLEELALPLRQEGLDVSTEVEFGDPLLEKLIHRIKATTADLVLKDTHHHSIARRTFLGNTDWQLIRACPVALLLTKSTPWSQRPRIVAAVDPGHVNDKPALLDERILEHGACIAKHLRGELHVVHAYVPMTIIAAAVSGEPPVALAISEQDIAREEQIKRREIRGMAERFDVAAERIHVEMGGPAQVLPHAARELHADIVVMGALSRRGLKRAFLGSTAEDVLEQLPCDELIVKPVDFGEALAGMCP